MLSIFFYCNFKNKVYNIYTLGDIMEILTELVTDKTNIIYLNNKYISDNKKENIIDIISPSSKRYYSKMYYQNNIWYYFKKDLDYGFYPFTIPEEIIGSYLATKLNLRTVEYEIAKVKNNYGIVSKNFKTQENFYYTFYDLVDIETNDNIDILKLFVTEENYEVLLDQILKLLALDTYMLQMDRCNINLQFEQNIKTKNILLAPIYDYANCIQCVNNDFLTKNILLSVTKSNFAELIQKYPKYKEYLDTLLEQNLKQIWQQICIDYKLNQDCFTYDRVSDYYEIKSDNQKKYLKELIKDIHL